MNCNCNQPPVLPLRFAINESFVQDWFCWRRKKAFTFRAVKLCIQESYSRIQGRCVRDETPKRIPSTKNFFQSDIDGINTVFIILFVDDGRTACGVPLLRWNFRPQQVSSASPPSERWISSSSSSSLLLSVFEKKKSFPARESWETRRRASSLP